MNQQENLKEIITLKPREKRLKSITRILKILLLLSWLFFLLKIPFFDKPIKRLDVLNIEVRFLIAFVCFIIIVYGLYRFHKISKTVESNIQEDIKQFLRHKTPSRSILTQLVIDIFINEELFIGWEYATLFDKLILSIPFFLFILVLFI
jgi:hypothetical protein